MTQSEAPILTAHLFVFEKSIYNEFDEMIERLTSSGIHIELHSPEEPLPKIQPKSPRIYVSIGDKEENFTTLYNLPYPERKRWLHYLSPSEVQPYQLFYCWLNRTDPFSTQKAVPMTKFSSDCPLVSVFTASYRSKEKILRPYQSLLKQTYSNWEWVIVDDSGDNDETYHKHLLTLDDPRVRRYRQDSNNGYIGATKRYAAGLSTGEILIELDHDDELMPDCIEKIVNAFQQHADCGFAFGNFAEVYEGSNNSHWYGWDCGFGYGIYYRVWVHAMQRWQNVMRNTVINASTVRHLVGLPNHPRAWTRDCYHLVGGHREELLVSDDYDLMIRTFLATKFVEVPDLLYLQYRNENGENSTFRRNEQIQVLVDALYDYNAQRINNRILELKLPIHTEYNRVWEMSKEDPGRLTAHILHNNPSAISLLFPIPYSAQESAYEKLLEALQEGLSTHFNHVEIVVVGCIPPILEHIAASTSTPTGAIRWWPMEQDASLDTCTKYADLCASCSQKILFLP
jgi:glycosyltransferase involved in cell wall biosynthesis